MNPFERLRHTIQKVNITYEFPEQEPEIEVKTATRAEGYSNQPQRTMSVNNNDDIEIIKQICENQQMSSIKQLNEMSSKIEQLQKNLKRSQTVIQNQMGEIVDLQKQNDQLKSNLTQQYGAVVQCDEKQRKYKQEIHRINVTINELAIEIQGERNSKKQLNKEIDVLKEKLKVKGSQFEQYRLQVEKEKMKLSSELEERVSMFEYNVMKGAEDRNSFKLTLSTTQDDHLKVVQAARIQIDRLKHQLLDAKKSLEIQILNRKNIDQNMARERLELTQLREINKKLEEELKIIKQNYEQSLQSKQILEKDLSSKGSLLEEQKKNIKVKVIQVRDQTLGLELQMYKRQCKQLLQQRHILKSMSIPQDGIFDPQFKIIKSHEASSV